MIDDIQFTADAMLGKLTKWLRVMGLDVMYDPDPKEALLLPRAAREGEGRIFLTRDRRLRQPDGLPLGLYIESNYYHEQVRQVVQTFELTTRLRAFSRCLRCNALLHEVAKQAVVHKVPPYVYSTQVTFKYCATCNRFYWGGTHRDNMIRQLQAMLRGLLPVTFEMPR